ncbi:MAG: CPBP family intramembrane metalloprotease [Burkholderiales bacterium]|nr:CPBP family intramembrane metalloprotease [Burkholderiales bacterium]
MKQLTANWGITPLAVLAGSLYAPAGLLLASLGSTVAPLPDWYLALLRGPFTYFILLSVLVIAPLVEELVFRKFAITMLLRGEIAPIAAVLLSAAAFASIHLNAAQAVPAFASGVFAGYLYLTSGRVMPCIAMHSAYNGSFAVLVAAYPSSIEALANRQVIAPGATGWLGIFTATLAFSVVYWLAVRRRANTAVPS